MCNTSIYVAALNPLPWSERWFIERERAANVTANVHQFIRSIYLREWIRKLVTIVIYEKANWSHHLKSMVYSWNSIIPVGSPIEQANGCAMDKWWSTFTSIRHVYVCVCCPTNKSCPLSVCPFLSKSLFPYFYKRLSVVLSLYAPFNGHYNLQPVTASRTVTTHSCKSLIQTHPLHSHAWPTWCLACVEPCWHIILCSLSLFLSLSRGSALSRCLLSEWPLSS